MAVRHGYGKIAGADALVFAYDTGDTRNSYRGEPTENLAPSGSRTGTSALPRQSYHIRPWTYSIKTNVVGRDSVIRLYIDPPGTDTTAPYADYGFYAYKAGGSQVGDVYTISMDYYVVKGNSTPGITIAYQNGYKDPTSTQAASWGSVKVKDLGGGWYRRIQSATITAAGNTWWRGGIGSNNIETEVYIDNIQVELKSHATPFVNGTRSDTQGLLDLTGNSTIDLNTVSFDSNAQMTFDGTDDKAEVANFPHIWDGSVSLETVVSWNNNTRSIIFGNYNVGANDINFEKLTSANLRFYWNRGERDVTTASNVVTTSGAYHHVVFIRDKDSNSFKFYVDGEIVGTSSNVGTDVTSTGSTFRIGGDSRDGTTIHNGDIPVLKLYNRALTAAEVKNNYNNYKGRFNI